LTRVGKPVLTVASGNARRDGEIMSRHSRRAILLSVWATTSLSYAALGGVSYLSGTSFYTHTPINGSATGVTTSSDASMPTSSNLSIVGYTISATATPLGGVGGQAGSSSTGTARAGYIANSTTASVALKSGTGISQTDPAGGTIYAFSETRLDFKDATALKWDSTAPSFGPTLTLYGSYTVAGTIGAGGFARCFVNLAFYHTSITGANRLGSVVLDTGTMSTAGAFNTTLTASVPSAIASLATGTDLLMIGTIQFQADNELAPTEVTLIDSSFGSSNSGQVSTYVGQSTGGNWFQSNTWQADDNALTNAPDGPGERAYIPNDQGVNRTFNLGTPVTLGILETSGSAGTVFTGAPLTLNNSNNAPGMIFQRGDYGNPTMSVQTPIQATDVITEILNESAGPILIQQGLGTNAQGATIVKTGVGPLQIGGLINHTLSNGATYDLRQGDTIFSSNLAGNGSSGFQSTVDVGSAGTTAAALFAAPQQLDTLSIGVNGKARINLPGKAAIAVENLTINTSASSAKGLDLGNDAIALRLNPGTLINAIRDLLASGFNNGAWNGPGINSSQIALDAAGSTAVGYARVSSITNNPALMFLGQAVDSNDIVVRYTINGDADLSGAVELNDFTRLAANFGLAGLWTEGDFNFNGSTNLDDFTVLAANFGRALPADLPRGAAVPEPAAAILAFTACVLARPRPRSGWRRAGLREAVQ